MNPDPSQPAQEQANLEPDRGNLYRPHKFMIHSGQFWRCKHGLTGWDRNMEFIGCKDCESDDPEAFARFHKKPVTPTHAPATEGQTGVKTIEEKCGQPVGSFAKHVAESGETFLPLFKTKEDAETFAIETLGERDAARATIVELEAQLAAMRDTLHKIANSGSELDATYEMRLAETALASSTSGQALLDRLAEAEKDKALLDWLENNHVEFAEELHRLGWKAPNDAQWEKLKLLLRRIRHAIASAMRRP